MRKFKNYLIWKKAQDLIPKFYDVISCFPEYEKYAMSSQLRRAVCSISANIAEGCSRSSPKDFGRFLEISLGSIFECQSFIDAAKSIRYIEDEVASKLDSDCEELARMINGLRRKVLNEKT